MSSDAYAGDVNVVLPFTARIDGTAIDLTGATLHLLAYRTENGRRGTIASARLSGVSLTAGTYRCTFLSGVLLDAGLWTFQLETTEGTVTTHYDPETKTIGARV